MHTVAGDQRCPGCGGATVGGTGGSPGLAEGCQHGLRFLAVCRCLDPDALRNWASHLDLAALAHIQGNQASAATHPTAAYALLTEVQVPRYVEQTVQLASEFGIALAAGSPHALKVRPGQAGRTTWLTGVCCIPESGETAVDGGRSRRHRDAGGASLAQREADHFRGRSRAHSGSETHPARPPRGCRPR
jgi:hypothetical protein